ncbi:cupin domain-containing protein [Patescibacteria group bacterium]|nr:cupin domain-containing protein [Patescibacteria group bacterium]MCL5409672.1 cupin domain-containing protein [Patescibacteria group bacterium]
MVGYVGQIEKLTKDNDDFRQVIFTAPHSQLVLMSLLPGEDIGSETHENVDQFFRIESGQGKTILNGEEHTITDGDAVVVPAGTEHNIVNASTTDKLKLYTIYSPANHRDGVIHHTKQDALADTEDIA